MIIGRLLHSNRTRGSNAIIQRSIAHTFNNGLTQRIHFLGIVRTKGGSNGRAIVHPAFQFELPDHLVPIRFDSTLGDLIAANVWFIQVVYKVDRQLDHEVSLRLGVIGIV